MPNPLASPPEYRFTKENAKQYSLMGAAVLRAKREARIKAEETQRAIIEAAIGSRDDYPVERMVRVRKQLDRIDELMLEELDPQRLDRLASAQARLSEQERILAGRPLPGSHRPSKSSRKDTAKDSVSPE